MKGSTFEKLFTESGSSIESHEIFTKHEKLKTEP